MKTVLYFFMIMVLGVMITSCTPESIMDETNQSQECCDEGGHIPPPPPPPSLGG